MHGPRICAPPSFTLPADDCLTTSRIPSLNNVSGCFCSLLASMARHKPAPRPSRAQRVSYRELSTSDESNEDTFLPISSPEPPTKKRRTTSHAIQTSPNVDGSHAPRRTERPPRNLRECFVRPACVCLLTDLNLQGIRQIHGEQSRKTHCLRRNQRYQAIT